MKGYYKGTKNLGGELSLFLQRIGLIGHAVKKEAEPNKTTEQYGA